MARTFRGYALDSTNGISLSDLRDAAPINGGGAPLLGDGVAFGRSSRGGRVVVFNLTVVGDNSTQFHARLRSLLVRLYDPSEGALVLDSASLSCRPRIGEIIYRTPVDDARMAEIGVTFESRASFWSAASAPVGTKTLTDNGVSEESATMTFGADYAPSFPAFEIESLKASLVSGYEVTLRNDGTGEELRLLDFDLGQNDVLIIDPAAEELKVTNTTGNAKPPRRVDGVFWPIEGASQTLIIKHNQIGLSPNFSVDWTIPGHLYTYKV